ncbi:MAG: hypothetical protein WD533_01310 [Dehalococcoidia bacterium]
MGQAIEEKTNRLLDATRSIVPEDLQWMALERSHLPAPLAAFELLQEHELDNETMAEQAFKGRTADSLAELGRITGYSREFVVPQGASTFAEEPAEVLQAATVVHLFDQPESVSRWIDDVFVRDFRGKVGQEEAGGQRITGVEVLEASGFHDHAASLLVVHDVPGGTLSSTIVDFRVGRLLGVAYVACKGDRAELDLARELGLALERQIVRVILGAA